VLRLTGFPAGAAFSEHIKARMNRQRPIDAACNKGGGTT
jgi:hypothetical protein